MRRPSTGTSGRSNGPQGWIDLIPAGRQGPTYATRMNSFDWQNFYDRLGGGGFSRRSSGACGRVRLRADRQSHRRERHVGDLHRADAGCAGRLLHAQQPEHRGGAAGRPLGDASSEPAECAAAYLPRSHPGREGREGQAGSGAGAAKAAFAPVSAHVGPGDTGSSTGATSRCSTSPSTPTRRSSRPSATSRFRPARCSLRWSGSPAG